MTRHTLKFVFMGSAMCLMLLGRVHRQLASVDAVGFTALGVFVGVHVLAALLALALPVSAATRSPAVHRFLKCIHRPNLHHVGLMIIGAILNTFSVHMWIHGGLI
jgi:hypothetical protein